MRISGWLTGLSSWVGGFVYFLSQSHITPSTTFTDTDFHTEKLDILTTPLS